MEETGSPLTSTHPDHLSYIFGFLQPDDLLELSLTCTTMKNLINEYCSTKFNHNLPMIEEFFNNEGCLSPKENRLKETLRKYNSPLMIQRLSNYYTKRVRVSCTDVDSFPHSINTQYFDLQFDENLKHNVLELKSVCWLEIKHKFKAVKPGKYRAAMRIKFTDQFYWPSYNKKNKVQLKAIFLDDPLSDTEIYREVFFPSSDWSEIKEMVEKERVNENLPPGCKLSNIDNKSGWFDLELSGPIELHNESYVEFIFRDIENRGWKTGMAFDYVELAPYV